MQAIYFGCCYKKFFAWGLWSQIIPCIPDRVNAGGGQGGQADSGPEMGRGRANAPMKFEGFGVRLYPVFTIMLMLEVLIRRNKYAWFEWDR